MAPESIPVWISLIGNFGFPIAITIYLFIRFERKLDKLEAVITHLADGIKSIDKINWEELRNEFAEYNLLLL